MAGLTFKQISKKVKRYFNLLTNGALHFPAKYLVKLSHLHQMMFHAYLLHSSVFPPLSGAIRPVVNWFRTAKQSSQHNAWSSYSVRYLWPCWFVLRQNYHQLFIPIRLLTIHVSFTNVSLSVIRVPIYIFAILIM